MSLTEFIKTNKSTIIKVSLGMAIGFYLGSHFQIIHRQNIIIVGKNLGG